MEFLSLMDTMVLKIEIALRITNTKVRLIAFIYHYEWDKPFFGKLLDSLL